MAQLRRIKLSEHGLARTGKILFGDQTIAHCSTFQAFFLLIRMIRVNVHMHLNSLSSVSWLLHMIRFKSPLFSLLGTLILASQLVTGASAAEPEVLLIIKNHRFEPAELKVPAGQRVKIVVHNQDSTPEEFESHDLNREKVVPPGAKASIYIGPLKAGRYSFSGEYNEATAKGVVIAE